MRKMTDLVVDLLLGVGCVIISTYRHQLHYHYYVVNVFGVPRSKFFFDINTDTHTVELIVEYMFAINNFSVNKKKEVDKNEKLQTLWLYIIIILLRVSGPPFIGNP